MQRPWRKVVRTEYVESSKPDYSDRPEYRERFIAKCAELGMLLRTKEDVDAAIEATRLLKRASKKRLVLACGHYVDVAVGSPQSKRVRCCLCQTEKP